MKKDENIFLLVGDLGFGGVDEIQKDFPDRFINCGASEATMLDIAVGLAYSDKTPFCYTITPFFLRGFETIRTYINHEKLNVKLVASGRDKDYEHDGFSHDATDIPEFFDQFKNIQSCYPQKKEDIKDILKTMLYHKKPYFLSLSRKEAV